MANETNRERQIRLNSTSKKVPSMKRKIKKPNMADVAGGKFSKKDMAEIMKLSPSILKTIAGPLGFGVGGESIVRKIRPLKKPKKIN